MAITNDAFGNYYMGNFIVGDLVNWTDVLSCFRQALGSNDRANLNIDNVNQVRIDARIDWRPNLVAETLQQTIPAPSLSFINLAFGGDTLAANSRIAFAYSPSNSHTIFPGGGGDNVIGYSSHINMPINIISTDAMWVVANKQNISYFIYRNSSNYHFFSQGFLLNSSLTFPQNAYSVVVNNITGYYSYQARGFAGTVVKTMHETGVKANYNHIKLSDGLPTQSGVELYLRDASTDIPYGYVPNVFKWKADGGEVALAIGDVVRLNMANATGEYAGQGNIFCKVVGRIGSNGDYLLMKIAS
jgi:hypothetical protein